MDYIPNRLMIFCALNILTLQLWGQQLSPLTPIHQLEDLLLLSGDQEVQYFRRDQKKLMVKNKLQEHELLAPAKVELTQLDYQVSSSWTGKKIAVLATEQPLQYWQWLQIGEIYVGDFGGKELLKVGIGVNPQLLLADQWLSYYRPATSQLVAKSLNLISDGEKIVKLNALPLQGHLPQVGMIDQESVLYTDQNSQGAMTLVRYHFKNKNFTFLHQSPAPKQLNFCLLGQNIFLLESDLNTVLLYRLSWSAGQILPKKEVIDQIETPNTAIPVLGPICTAHPQFPVLFYSHQQLHRYLTDGKNLSRKKLPGYTGLWSNHQMIYMEKEGRHDVLRP